MTDGSRTSRLPQASGPSGQRAPPQLAPSVVACEAASRSALERYRQSAGPGLTAHRKHPCWQGPADLAGMHHLGPGAASERRLEAYGGACSRFAPARACVCACARARMPVATAHVPASEASTASEVAAAAVSRSHSLLIPPSHGTPLPRPLRTVPASPQIPLAPAPGLTPTRPRAHADSRRLNQEVWVVL